ncbi:uncharacterized protein DFL_005792 [Arthrobotrys flagrans]|uniref:Uncharacterized protein n=1 Tax=Arthrobotrys flagrans TaxID=97331 RepID=A0A436ZYJ9_ARTFL|nr:hypothetical protein DFL_005792 [Arthrobotrys flagrans]
MPPKKPSDKNKKDKGKRKLETGKKADDDEASVGPDLDDGHDEPENEWYAVMPSDKNLASIGLKSSTCRINLRHGVSFGRLRSRKYDTSFKKGWAIQSNGYKSKRDCTNCRRGLGPFRYCKGFKEESAKKCGNCTIDRRTCRGAQFVSVVLPKSARSRAGNKVKATKKGVATKRRRVGLSRVFGRKKKDTATDASAGGDDEEEEEEEDENFVVPEEWEAGVVEDEDWEGLDPPADLPSRWDPFDSDDDASPSGAALGVGSGVAGLSMA